MIPFNKPYLTGKETQYIAEAVKIGKISGNGSFTQKCQQFFEQEYGFKKCLLTTSCTDALEMCAILADIQPNDEVNDNDKCSRKFSNDHTICRGISSTFFINGKNNVTLCCLLDNNLTWHNKKKFSKN